MFKPDNEDTLIVYSEDPDLRGLTKKYCFTAYLLDYITQTKDNFIEAAEIEFIDPCIASPESLEYEDASYTGTPEDVYNYDYSGDTLTMPIRVLIPTPSFCTITYSCDLAQVPKKNLIASPVDCNTSGLTTFDTTTGELTFTAGLDRFDEIYAG